MLQGDRYPLRFLRFLLFQDFSVPVGFALANPGSAAMV